MVVPLDDLQEHSGPVLHGFGEDLQQVAIVVVVNQDLQLLKLQNRVGSGANKVMKKLPSYKQAVV